MSTLAWVKKSGSGAACCAGNAGITPRANAIVPIHSHERAARRHAAGPRLSSIERMSHYSPAADDTAGRGDQNAPRPAGPGPRRPRPAPTFYNASVHALEPTPVARRPARTDLPWSAGAAFVAAAAWFAYFYGVTLGSPAPARRPAARGAWVPIASNVGAFTLFALHHSLLARPAAKRWLARRLPPDVERSTYVWIASLLLMLVCGLWIRVGGLVWQTSGPAAWVGHGAQALGAAIFFQAGRRIDPRELVGLRQVTASIASSASAAASATAELHVGGPYRLVRHPLYLGMLLLAWPIPIMTLDRLVLALCLTAYIAVAVPWEERGLRAEHGDAYRRYADRVRWRVIPGVY